MAITEVEYHLLRVLRGRDLLPQGGDILEIGRANWYGDVSLEHLFEDIDRYGEPGQRDRLRRITDANERDKLFDIAEVCWETFLRPRSMAAIDLHGGRKALPLDLNSPIDLGRTFDLVMNFGTLEHVFNVATALKTVHDHTAPGGMMIHGMPFQGWLDHGFFSFHPTFYWDLAAANGYEVVTLLVTSLDPIRLIRLQTREDLAGLARQGELPAASNLHAVLRRPLDARPFKVPLQGYYAGQVSEAVSEAWRELR